MAAEVIYRKYLFGLITYQRTGNISILQIAGKNAYSRIGESKCLFGVFLWGDK